MNLFNYVCSSDCVGRCAQDVDLFTLNYINGYSNFLTAGAEG